MRPCKGGVFCHYHPILRRSASQVELPKELAARTNLIVIVSWIEPFAVSHNVNDAPIAPVERSRRMVKKKVGNHETLRSAAENTNKRRLSPLLWRIHHTWTSRRRAVLKGATAVTSSSEHVYGFHSDKRAIAPELIMNRFGCRKGRENALALVAASSKATPSLKSLTRDSIS